MKTMMSHQSKLITLKRKYMGVIKREEIISRTIKRCPNEHDSPGGGGGGGGGDTPYIRMIGMTVVFFRG